MKAVATFEAEKINIHERIVHLRSMGCVGQNWEERIKRAVKFPLQSYLTMRPSSPEQILEYRNKLPTWLDVFLILGEDYAVYMIEALMLELASLVNVKRGLTDEMIRKLAGLIAQDQEINKMRVPEIVMAVQFGISGKMGAIYDRLDAAIILSWLRTYHNQYRIPYLQQAKTMKIHKEEEEKPTLFLPNGANEKAKQKGLQQLIDAKTTGIFDHIKGYHFGFINRNLEPKITDDELNAKMQEIEPQVTQYMQDRFGAGRLKKAEWESYKVNKFDHYELKSAAMKLCAMDWIKNNTIEQ